ncbi:MAG: N-acetylneuraminate synthase family protein [Treponema sp.]|nr:N-acetylneuraminate synthase family protein [Treponema sp.]
MDIVAEIGTSHSGDFEKAKKLIDVSAQNGADVVKFQWVYADEILHPDTGFVNLPGGKTRLYDTFKSIEVAPSFFKDCMDYVHSLGKKFMCSPFGTKSLEELLSIKPDFVKIASPELNHIPLLSALAEYRKTTPVPVVISSGVSRLCDIENALSILGTDGITLLHCITFYPAPEEEYNLRLIPNLSRIFGIPCGVSDHSLSPILVPSLACALGSTMIEKHITLSKKMDGVDDPVALEGEEFGFMNHAVRQCEAVFRQYGKERGRDYIIKELKGEYGERIEKILGDGVKRLSKSEEQNYGRTNRSLHFLRAMKKGETVKKSDIGVLRTEKILSPGMHPKFLDDIDGRTLVRDVENGAGVVLADFMA